VFLPGIFQLLVAKQRQRAGDALALRTPLDDLQRLGFPAIVGIDLREGRKMRRLDRPGEAEVELTSVRPFR
jgi:hypothetical protein